MAVATEREVIDLNILKEFSRTPGGRFIDEGPFSGEAFRNEVLLPKFKLALQKDAILRVNLDGTGGCPTSFLEEAFGGLARIYKSAETVLEHIDIKSDEEPYQIKDIRRYILEANDEK